MTVSYTLRLASWLNIENRRRHHESVLWQRIELKMLTVITSPNFLYDRYTKRLLFSRDPFAVICKYITCFVLQENSKGKFLQITI